MKIEYFAIGIFIFFIIHIIGIIIIDVFWIYIMIRFGFDVHTFRSYVGFIIYNMFNVWIITTFMFYFRWIQSTGGEK